MAFHRRARFAVAFIAINCLLLASLVMAQQHDDKQELRAKLFKQVLSDFTDLRECYEKEEGGLPKAQENMNVEEHDLNNDGVNEYEVELSGPCSCGTTATAPAFPPTCRRAGRSSSRCRSRRFRTRVRTAGS